MDPAAAVSTIHKEEDVIKNLKLLVGRGWIPLSRMATLLGYTSTQAIFKRQKGNNPIPTVKVGGIQRVYREDALHVLQLQTELSVLPKHQKYHAVTVLDIYRSISHGKSIRTT